MKAATTLFSIGLRNNAPAWCNGQGNPTKCSIVNSLIKEVEKMEVHGEGTKSKVKQVMTQPEFLKELRLLLQENDDLDHQVTLCTLLLWQYHLIGRVDDAANSELRSPNGHGKYDFAMLTKVSW